MKKRKLQPWYFVGDLAADWWWDEDYCYRLLHGRIVWETASFACGTQNVRAMRYDAKNFRVVIRYFPPTQQVVLVPR